MIFISNMREQVTLTTKMADLIALRQQLESNEDVVGCLESLNALLVTNTSASFVSEVLSVISLPVLFSCLQTDVPEQLQLICAVLDKLLFHLPASELVKHSQYVELGLQYPKAKVASTCLKALLHLTASANGNDSRKDVEELILTPTMLHLITQMLAGEDLQCASLAAKILLWFSIQPESIEMTWLAELGPLLTLNDTIRYRVYDLLAQICLQGGAKCFKIVEDSGYLQKLVGELETSDPLVKMNCIELLSSLTETPEGISFLQSSQVLDNLYQILTSSQEDVVGAIVIPAILKFFGLLCLSLGSDAALLFDTYPHFLQLTLEAVLSPHDETLWGVSVDTFGLLSSTLSGRTLLLTKEQSTKQVLSKLGEVIAGSPSDVRCRALRAVRMMVMCVEDCSWEQSTSRRWFAEIYPNPFQLLLSVVRQPFSDLRLAGLMVIVEMAAWEWGQREMQACPGFLEYLLDRNSGPDKESKELKYEVVHRVVGSECGEVLWSTVDMIKIKKYDREGPFYHAGDTTVAIEGAL